MPFQQKDELMKWRFGKMKWPPFRRGSDWRRASLFALVTMQERNSRQASKPDFFVRTLKIMWNVQKCGLEQNFRVYLCVGVACACACVRVWVCGLGFYDYLNFKKNFCDFSGRHKFQAIELNGSLYTRWVPNIRSFS